MYITDKKVWVKYISAFVLGDGSLQYSVKQDPLKTSKRNARYQLSQLKNHQDYVDWQREILENITPVTLYEKSAWEDKDGTAHQNILYLKTRTHPLYTTMRKRLYPNGIKALSPHDLKLFDAESLAILFMDDGHLRIRTGKKESTRGYHIYLSTQSYSYGDNLLLSGLLKDKFEIISGVYSSRNRKGVIQYTLEIFRKEDTKRFIDTVSPYILPSFYYKIDK